MEPVKLGIIGCGIATRELHWPVLKRMKDKFKVTVVCNHTEPKAKDFAKIAGGVPYVLDYHDLLKRDDVEAVSVVLPFHLNYLVTKDALIAGKHVIVEKPLAATLADAKKIVALEKQFSQVMMVAENYRYRPVFHKVKACIDEGKIGEIFAIYWNMFMDLETKYVQVKWRKESRHEGGMVLDGGVHYVAALQFLVGKITSGIALTKRINPEVGGKDTCSLQFTTENNVQGVFNMAYSVKGFAEDRILILGKEGTIIVEPQYKIVVKRYGQKEIEEKIEVDIGYQGEFEDFYRAIKTGKEPVATFSKSFKDLKIIMYALKSEKSGKRFRIK